MRLLLIGDSHCYDMTSALQTLNQNLSVFPLILGSQILPLTLKYRSKIPSIIRFDPEYTILHVGHNNMARHSYYNQLPLVSRDVSRLTMTLANELHVNHPRSKLLISSVFPRTFTDHSNLSATEVTKFNKTVKRHGQRIQTRAAELGHTSMLTSVLWHRISKAEEDPSYFDLDGLHLNPEGKRAIAIEWSAVMRMNPILT
jgi:lysophospholipase L1-like esterase